MKAYVPRAMGGEAVPHTAPFLGSRQPLLFAAATCFIPSSLRDEIKRMRKRKGECCFFRRKTVRRGRFRGKTC